MKTKDMVNVKFSKFFRRHFFFASHKVHQLSKLVDEDTNTIVTPARLRKLDNKVEGHRRAFAWSGDAKKLSSNDSIGKNVAKYSKLGQNERLLLHWVGLGTL
jgi:hypothetical protein